jgi:uncharacterized protein YcbK (DUF882 family)
VKKLIVPIIVILFVVLIKLLFFYPANKDVQLKLRMIHDEVAKRGYKTSWIVISGKRSSWYNNLLSNSKKGTSNHLVGKAIDIYVFDIDGDNKFTNSDIEILKSANNSVENDYPRLKGSFGTYTTKGYFSRNMVHLDVTGHSKNYNK